MSMRKSLTRILAVCTLAAAAGVATALPASATEFDVTYDCRADTPLGDEYATQTQTVDITAPEAVAPGADFDVVIDPGTIDVPSEANGYQLNEIRDIELKAPVPENSTFDSAELSGGSNIGDGPNTVTESDGVVTVSIPGPIEGGTTAELPVVTAHLTAGQSGTIETMLYGTNYDDPGLTFTAEVRVIFSDVDVPTDCFPNPSPVFTTTTIG